MRENFLSFAIISIVEVFLSVIGNKPPTSKAVKKLLATYEKEGLKARFQSIRFQDAPLLEVEKLVPEKGTIIELGSGDGLFSNFLAISSEKRRVYGYELNKERVRVSDRGLRNASFKHADVLKIKINKADAVVCFHLFHHLPSFSSQIKLLKKIKNGLKKSGTLVIVEVEPRFSIKYLITYITDHFLVPWVFEGRIYSDIFFRSKLDWETELVSLGFNVVSTRADKGKPFSHIIYVCTLKK